MSNKWQNYDAEQWDDQDEPGFQPLKKQTVKPTTVKGDRRQIAKEWGRSMHKFHKQRAKTNGKP
jgi:hypothetical protein